MSSSLVSVIITNHNYGHFLDDCLQSVLAQTYPHVQTVVVDDGSTDHSLEVLQPYRQRIEVLAHARPGGQWVALSAAMRICRGEVICLLDADDWWYPEKVARTIEIFESKPAAGWLRHKLAVTSAQGGATGARIPHFTGSRLHAPTIAAVNERLFIAVTSALALRMDLARTVLTEVEGTARWDADALLVARCAAARSPVYSLDEALGTYRRHAQQQFTTDADMQRMLERQIEVGERIARELALPAPVSNFKHQLINQSLAGRPRLHPERLRTTWRALLRAGRLLSQPRLFVRQMASLAFAAAAPNWWLVRLRKRTGYPCA